MNKPSGLANVFITLFILILCTLVILAVFGAINTDTLTDGALKAAAALGILTVASFLIAWLQGNHK